jgi:transposase
MTGLPPQRQSLNFRGLDLATQQSGQFRGLSRLSIRGNARLRAVFWMAAIVGVRMRENSFRAKYEHDMRADPGSANRERKASLAIAVKIARVAFAPATPVVGSYRPSGVSFHVISRSSDLPQHQPASINCKP